MKKKKRLAEVLGTLDPTEERKHDGGIYYQSEYALRLRLAMIEGILSLHAATTDIYRLSEVATVYYRMQSIREWSSEFFPDHSHCKIIGSNSARLFYNTRELASQLLLATPIRIVASSVILSSVLLSMMVLANAAYEEAKKQEPKMARRIKSDVIGEIQSVAGYLEEMRGCIQRSMDAGRSDWTYYFPLSELDIRIEGHPPTDGDKVQYLKNILGVG